MQNLSENFAKFFDEGTELLGQQYKEATEQISAIVQEYSV